LRRVAAKNGEERWKLTSDLLVVTLKSASVVVGDLEKSPEGSRQSGIGSLLDHSTVVILEVPLENRGSEGCIGGDEGDDHFGASSREPEIIEARRSQV